jgi:dsDNA-specific endonuclease/ATPase MutS2
MPEGSGGVIGADDLATVADVADADKPLNVSTGKTDGNIKNNLHRFLRQRPWMRNPQYAGGSGKVITTVAVVARHR